MIGQQWYMIDAQSHTIIFHTLCYIYLTYGLIVDPQRRTSPKLELPINRIMIKRNPIHIESINLIKKRINT